MLSSSLSLLLVLPRGPLRVLSWLLRGLSLAAWVLYRLNDALFKLLLWHLLGYYDFVKEGGVKSVPNFANR